MTPIVVCQGRGVGRALLRELLTHADDRQSACYPETDRPEKPAFYGAAGFSVEQESYVLGVRICARSDGRV